MTVLQKRQRFQYTTSVLTGEINAIGKKLAHPLRCVSEGGGLRENLMINSSVGKQNQTNIIIKSGIDQMPMNGIIQNTASYQHSKFFESRYHYLITINAISEKRISRNEEKASMKELQLSLGTAL